MRRPTALLAAALLAFAAGCYRQPGAEVTLRLPEAESREELLALRNHLLSEHDRLHEVILYESVRVREEPPALIVEYNPRHLAARNVEERLRELGYTVNDLPGDPAKRARFRAGIGDGP